MTGCKDYDEIQVISLRDLKLSSAFIHLERCSNLKILFLSGNRIIYRDLLNLNKLTSLIKLDLSANDIQDLPKQETFFSSMENL